MNHLSGALALRVFLCFASAYLLSFAFRSINAVIAPALTADVGLSNADLGLLSSAYFLTFAALQLPLGIWLDKYGPRKTDSALLLFAAAGAAIFASSTSLAGLWVGRALIGVGVSACLMAAYKAYRQWFAPEQQSQLANLMLVAGTSGALLATVPVSAAMPLIGWRGIFWVMSVLILLVAAAIFFLLKKVETSFAAPAPAVAHAAGATPLGYRHIFGHPYFRRLWLVVLINSGSFSAIQTLWAGPWMTTTLDMDRESAARVLFAINLCQMLAYLFMSWCAPRYISIDGSRGWRITRFAMFSLTGAIVVQAMIVALHAPWTWALWLVLVLFTTFAPVLQTSVSLSFPSSLAGRANSAYNLLVFSGAFLIQWGIGLLADIFRNNGLSPADALRAAFAVILGAQVLALLSFVVQKAEPLKH